MIKIDKDVPLPKPHSRHNGLYPFPNMAIGDSFVGGESAVNSAYAYNRNHPEYKFSTRRIKEDPGYRIWRVK